jgi:hypothetical protein
MAKSGLSLVSGVAAIAMLSACATNPIEKLSIRADLILEGTIETNGKLEFMFGDVGFEWHSYILTISGAPHERLEFVSDHPVCPNGDLGQRYLVILQSGMFYVNKKRSKLFVASHCLPTLQPSSDETR